MKVVENADVVEIMKARAQSMANVFGSPCWLNCDSLGWFISREPQGVLEASMKFEPEVTSEGSTVT